MSKFRRQLMMASMGEPVPPTPVLPYDAEVQWLQKYADYFPTDMRASGNIVMKIWLQDYFNADHKGYWAFGGRTAYNNDAFGLYIDGNTSKVRFSYNGDTLEFNTCSSYPESCWVEIGNGTIKIGSTTHTYTKKTFTNPNYNVWLFGLNNGGSMVDGNVKIGEAEISNGTTSLHVKPVRVGTTGYFYNVDTGILSTRTFIAGPDVTT